MEAALLFIAPATHLETLPDRRRLQLGQGRHVRQQLAPAGGALGRRMGAAAAAAVRRPSRQGDGHVLAEHAPSAVGGRLGLNGRGAVGTGRPAGLFGLDGFDAALPRGWGGGCGVGGGGGRQ